MNILSHLFRKAKTVETTIQTPSADEITLRLLDVEAAIAAGEGDVVALMKEARELKDQQAAARIQRQNEEQRAYLEKIEQQSAEYRKRLLRCTEAVGDLAPRLMWELQELVDLETESYNVPNSQFDSGGLPFGYARQVLDALRAASTRVEYGYDFLSGGKNTPPQLKSETSLSFRLPPGPKIERVGGVTYTNYDAA